MDELSDVCVRYINEFLLKFFACCALADMCDVERVYDMTVLKTNF